MGVKFGEYLLSVCEIQKTPSALVLAADDPHRDGIYVYGMKPTGIELHRNNPFRGPPLEVSARSPAGSSFRRLASRKVRQG